MAPPPGPLRRRTGRILSVRRVVARAIEAKRLLAASLPDLAAEAALPGYRVLAVAQDASRFSDLHALELRRFEKRERRGDRSLCCYTPGVSAH
jgi:hypothetical protein